MAEALGIASGIAGIVSLGITICSGLDTYFSAIKDRDDDLKRASDLVSLLRRYIELIRPSASTLSSRHAQATDLVALALGSCEAELRALKELVDNLNKVDGASDVARKWDKSKAVITYPFQRKKLTQIQDQLLKATGALGTVIQALILHVGVSVGDDLEAFRTAVQDNHLVTAAFLTRIESKVERVEVSTQQTEERLTAISTGFEEQKALASNSQTMIKDTSLMVSGKLDAMVEGLRLGRQSQTVGTAQQKDIPRYLRNSMIEMKCIQDTATGICPCQRQKDKTRQQPLTTYRFWGGLAISYQSMSKGDHQPGCCFYKRSTKTTITYTGLRFLLSKVLSFSLQSDYQRGSSLTTHSPRIHNVRKTSPAFNVFDSYISLGLEVDLKTQIQEHMKELQIAYTSGMASPLDVDEIGRNVAHRCIQCYYLWMSNSAVAEQYDGPESLRMMLMFLQQVGVDVYAGTNYDSSMIGFVIRRCVYRTLAPVYDVLAKCDSQFDPGQDFKPTGDGFVRAKGILIHALQERPDIMEGLGYTTLFMAVAKRDEARLKELIQNIKFVEYVRQTDFFGQNILHFCLGWENGLRLLLEKETTHHLVNQPNAGGFTPLMDALKLSGAVCQEPWGLDPCPGCGCSSVVKLLLETDCTLRLGSLITQHTWYLSCKAKKALLEHVGQRRERLRRLALHHLPETELRDLGVSFNELPDMTAPAIWNRLQSLHQSGVVKVLHNGLDPLMESRGLDHVQQGIFHVLDNPRDAEVAFNLGFKGVDTPNGDGVTPVLHSDRFGRFEDQLLYADWLIQKGARLEYCANSLGISAAHILARCCGNWVGDKFSESKWHVQAPIHIERVLLAVVHSTAQSRLPCPCTTEELSLPLHHLVVALLDDVRTMFANFKCANGIAKVVYLVDLLPRVTSDLDLTRLVKSIIHILTMKSLCIRHLPACHGLGNASEEKVQRTKEVEEWDEILDEDRALIEKLGELTEEFEQEFINQNVSMKDFLRLHWRPRMRQVDREQKAVSESYRKELRGIGVVLNDESEQDVSTDSYYTSEWDSDSEDDYLEDDDRGEGASDGEVGEHNPTEVKGNVDNDNVG